MRTDTHWCKLCDRWGNHTAERHPYYVKGSSLHTEHAPPDEPFGDVKIDSSKTNIVRARALLDVGIERERQLLLQAQGRFKHTLSDDGMTDFERLACIIEEVGEVSRDVLCRAGLATDGDVDDAALRKELSQVAALAVAWMERL